MRQINYRGCIAIFFPAAISLLYCITKQLFEKKRETLSQIVYYCIIFYTLFFTYLSAIFFNNIKLFLFSVFTGCGSIAPKSTWGKVATMGYASLGIPLTLVYLSSAGGLLSRCARGVFTRALCCCLCSNCGYCCYDERRMQVSGDGACFSSLLDKKI